MQVRAHPAGVRDRAFPCFRDDVFRRRCLPRISTCGNRRGNGRPPACISMIREATVGTALLFVVEPRHGAGDARHGSRPLQRRAGGLAARSSPASTFIGLSLAWLRAKPFTISTNAYGSIYYAMTGFHLLHVTAGIGILLAGCSSGMRKPGDDAPIAAPRRRSDDLLLAFRLYRVGRHLRRGLPHPMKHRQEVAIAAMLGVAIAGSFGFIVRVRSARRFRSRASRSRSPSRDSLRPRLRGRPGSSATTGGRSHATNIRPPARSGLAASAELEHAQTEVSRSGALMRLLVAALGVFGIAALFPFRSLGPALG